MLAETGSSTRGETAARIRRSSGGRIGARVGYEESAFFRRLFERLTGLTPGQYRRMFPPMLNLPVASPGETG